jgi:hypothetical protein
MCCCCSFKIKPFKAETFYSWYIYADIFYNDIVNVDFSRHLLTEYLKTVKLISSDFSLESSTVVSWTVH